MSLKFKKIHYVIIAVILFLLITNPSMKAFKEHVGYSTQLERYFVYSRKMNLFVCSTFNFNYSSVNDSYFAIAGNFFLISRTLKSDTATKK
jgi:hypothetical protein